MPNIHEMLSPLVAPDAYCSVCGNKLKVAVDKNKQGHPLSITYTCKNAETGCAYFTVSDQRLNSMLQPIKDK